MEKHFNNAGPVNMDDMYKIDPLKRWDLDEVLDLIDQRKYFILHAPQQTGKTSCLLALRDYLNEEGKNVVVYVNMKVVQAFVHDEALAIKALVNEIKESLFKVTKEEKLHLELADVNNDNVNSKGLSYALSYICRNVEKPVVIFFDNMDALSGDFLFYVLRQIRSRFDQRPDLFPSSMVFSGIYGKSDYNSVKNLSFQIVNAVPFNIITTTFTLSNFSKEEVINLYTQHTTETGQVFEADIFDLVMDYTNGHPCLVNALAREVTYEMKENRDRTVVITKDKLAEAKERLIQRRDTNLDQLVDKLR